MGVGKRDDLFEIMVSNLTMNFMETTDEIMVDTKEYKLPGRLTVLAEGFARNWDLDVVNEKLKEKGYEALYARSLYEAGMIYAFSHHLSYEEWKELYQDYIEKDKKIADQQNKWFSGGKITLNQLADYVNENSSGQMNTMMLTTFMEQEIIESFSKEDFYEFMHSNIQNFSSVREKARYYFCKYLNLYIQEKCDRYYECCEKSERMRLQYGNALDKDERGYLEKFALEELNFLKPLTKLKKEAQKSKQTMTRKEKQDLLENTALTPGGIFDEFNYFYFGYVSVDWMELVLELYGPVKEWPEGVKIRVAHALGYCTANPSEYEKKAALEHLHKMEQEQILREEELDNDYSRGSTKTSKNYQRGRSGEDYFREFITGKRDINRGTLISFLLFVKMKVGLSDENKITLARLNHILENCGFAQLRPDREFDRFVMEFLRSKDPFAVLEQHVDDRVTNGQDFYLYKVYRDAYCHQNELAEYLTFKE